MEQQGDHDQHDLLPEKTTSKQTSFDINGWNFVCSSDGSVTSEQRQQLLQKLRLNAQVPLPEMVFGGNSMTVQHTPSNFTIQFTAQDALMQWADSHREESAEWDQSSFDFTYCSDYKGTVSREISVDHDKKKVIIEGMCTSETMPLEKLKQELPILYYERVLLLEDDVRDLGEIYLETRIRVMDFGFLILCRYYCRVDEKIIKLIDTRYYHEFATPFVWRDREVREGTIPALQKILYPTYSGTRYTQLDFCADIVYAGLQPTSSYTEQLPLA